MTEGRRTRVRLPDPRWTVPIAALTAFLLRLPGLALPIRADEAGFLLVARAWAPAADSVYGPYFVDRPPLLIWLYGAADAVGGPLLLRVVGAAGCAAVVLLAAAIARTLDGERTARWTAVCAAAVTTTPLIDVVSVKGELLGLPLVMAGCWLALLAVRRTSVPLALLAGVASGTALHLKQSLVTGLVFAAVLLVTSVLVRALAPGRAVLLAAAGLVGAAVPVLATLAWANAAGVGTDELWYAAVSFRSDAGAVLAEGTSDAPRIRALQLLGIALGSGLLVMMAGVVRHLRSLRRADPAVAIATLAVLVADTTALALGGSFWRPYLFGLVPATVLATALLLREGGRLARRTRIVVVGATLSASVTYAGWLGYQAMGVDPFTEVHTGEAIARVAAPDDTLVVFGGRADIQLASGLPSPYEHLWSLPMRTLDPDYEQLRALVSGPDAPTWFVQWVSFGSWQAPGGAALEEAVREHYVPHGTGCDDRPIWLLRGETRPAVQPICD